jgi:hypothetical protein
VAFTVLGDGHLLVECGRQQRREVFCGPAARIARLGLLETGVDGRLAVVRHVLAFGLGPLVLRKVSVHIRGRNCQYSNTMIANEPHPVRPLISQFRPLRGDVRPPARASRSTLTNYLIQRALSRMNVADLPAQKIIRPVFRLLQGSKRQAARRCAGLLAEAAHHQIGNSSSSSIMASPPCGCPAHPTAGVDRERW